MRGCRAPLEWNLQFNFVFFFVGGRFMIHRLGVGGLNLVVRYMVYRGIFGIL